MLRVDDVDLHHGVINIRYSKGHDQHYVVLHDSMLKLLKIYDPTIQKQYPDRSLLFSRKGQYIPYKKMGTDKLQGIVGQI